MKTEIALITDSYNSYPSEAITFKYRDGDDLVAIVLGDREVTVDRLDILKLFSII